MRLDGVRVLDLTRLLPGPYATQLLADAGADVIKVEDTGAGDYARHNTPRTDRDVGPMFDTINRGKRSVALDLKTDEGLSAFFDLVEDADVVFEQFRPGVVEKLGVDYEAVREVNDEIIYCSLSGYGQTGPYEGRVGHDLNYVGVAGLLDMTREDEAMAPQIPGYQIGDLGGGLFAAFTIVGALASRELGNTGGEYIDVAMTDVVASFSQSVAHEAFRGEDPRPGETTLTGELACYDIYETADGRYMTLGALEPKFWQAFCEEVGREDLVDRHMEEGDDLREEVADVFAQRTQAEWVEQLSDETMTAPVNTPEEMVEHEQLVARGVIERPDEEGVPPRVGYPALSTEEPEESPTDVPLHGEDTEAVLREADYDEARIEALREADAIK
jgi:crotonobetainyl-CoA:carnitine CoA-transferase CaiB-like acyl-CoA transferase